MLKKIFLVLVLIFSTCTSVISQYTETFNKIDAKHSFKDVVFGTSLSVLKTKMGLKNSEFGGPTQYTINNKKYLSIGIYNAWSGSAIFSNNRLFFVSLSIQCANSVEYNQIVEYFTEIFGQPEEDDESYKWIGNKLFYNLLYEPKSQSAAIDIRSILVKNEQGKDNF